MLLENLERPTVTTPAPTTPDPLKPRLTADDWQLYTCSTPPSVMRRVAETLNNAAGRTLRVLETKLSKLKLGTPREEVLKVVREAYAAHLGKAMRRNAKHGACDTEPEWVASDLVSKFTKKYGFEVSRWDL